MRVRQKMLSLLLAAALALGALPGTALAREEAPGEIPASVPAETPAETPASAPAEIPEETPASAPAATPAEIPEETPASAPESAPAKAQERAADSGYCGENGGTNVRWSLDAAGTLTISGTGAMKDFGPPAGTSGTIETPPWRNECAAVVIEEGVTSVGSFAFYNCSKLKRADIAGSVESIGFKAFFLSASLESAVFGEGVKTIGEQAFCECGALQAARFPDSLSSIEKLAFGNCVGLTEVIIPQNVASVGEYTFDGCKNLAKAAFPEGLEVPDSALPTEVEKITYTGETPDDFDSIVENPGGSTGENPGGNTGENPGGNTGENPGGSTGENPGGSTGENPGGSTGENPGGDMPVTPPPAETVSSGPCGTSVSYVLDSNGLLTIRGNGKMGDYSGYSCPPWSTHIVKTVVIEEGVTSAGAYAFYNCKALESVRLPESLTAVGNYGFYGCATLPSVDIPQAVTSLGYNAFMGCGNLKEARVSLGLKKSVQSALPAACQVTYYGTTGGDCGKTPGTVTWTLDANGLLTIQGKGAMRDYGSRSPGPWGAEGVKTVVIEEGVSSVGGYAFYGCKALESVRLPESLTGIGSNAFEGCAALPSVTIPQAVTSLGYNTFSGCGSLKEARVHRQLKQIPSNVFPASCTVTRYGTATGDCGEIQGTVTWALDGDGLLTIRGKGRMKNFPYTYYAPEIPWDAASVKAVVVEDGVTSLGDYAFYQHKALESVRLPDSLTAIGRSAFNYCSALTEITLPRNLGSIKGQLLFYQSGLTRARVFYRTEYEPSNFPEDCLISIYGKTLTPGKPLRASRTAPAGSDNLHVGHWSRPKCSYLAPGDGGGFYRVDYSEENGLVMEEYGPGGAFYQGWDIPMELPMFGGFYSGSDGFYFVFGQQNPQESDSVEVLRVVKYTRDLERLGDARLMGGNTRDPFGAASCRMAEGNGLLYIHTGHRMMKSSDGLNHQACMTFSVDMAALEFQYQFYGVAHYETNGYVSHSFDQYIRVDGDRVIRLDLGDAYPRGAALFVNGPSLAGRPVCTVAMEWSGREGDNNTGSWLGGLEVSQSAYLTALSSVDQTGGNQHENETFNVYLLVTDKETLKTRTVQVTHYSEGGPVSVDAPRLVKFSDGRFLLLWEEQKGKEGYFGGMSYSEYTGRVKYAFFDGEGNQLGGIQSMPGAMSDCQPEIIDGKAVWYVTEDGGKPVFYQIGSDGKAGSFTPTTGQKPSGGSVTLPGEIRDVLAEGAPVFAASYSGGRLTGVYQGTVKDGKAVFSRKPLAGWTLYFPDGTGAPACPALKT